MKKEIEIWKPVNIAPFTGMYEVSNFGKVKKLAITVEHKSKIIPGERRKKQEFVLTQSVVNGYLSVALFNGNTKKQIKVHRLVALHFIGNPNNYDQINHKDGNKMNNHCSNLEWCDQSHNMKHAHSIGLVNSPVGIDCHAAILTNDNVNHIRDKVRELKHSLAKKFGVSYCAIHDVIMKRTWKHIK